MDIGTTPNEKNPILFLLNNFGDMLTKFATFLFFSACFLGSTTAYGIADTGYKVENALSVNSFGQSDSATIYPDLWAKISKAKSEENPKIPAKSYAALGKYHSDYEHLDSALFCPKNVEAIHLKHHDKMELAGIYGNAAKGTGFVSQSIDLLTRQLHEVLRKADNTGTSLNFHFHPAKTT